MTPRDDAILRTPVGSVVQHVQTGNTYIVARIGVRQIFLTKDGTEYNCELVDWVRMFDEGRYVLVDSIARTAPVDLEAAVDKPYA